ncbi:DUF1244 domain-containing protein [Endozoicomonas sp. 8E]|uniref:DUF1244 domain-containing protein n=1 Tax=Endozoicomonas sp. 8E TaxID=3035692 RepID=UPI00293916B9|nr:DUF1244 domain-containing protein [Endozoicomonas sp. 8E]WOG28798.1 DUF1244 domain-containing protein [Endozoicomonas sp. 8E]
MNTQIDQETQDKLDAATFRRLLKHLDDNKEVQNIDLMILANFCRNCLGKWYKTAADDLGVEVSDNEARERIYGMPYSQWKEKHQQPASEEQLAAFKARQKK